MQKRHEKSLTKKSIVLITNQLTLLLIKKNIIMGQTKNIILRKFKQLMNREYPLEILYDDGSRSWKPQEGKKPWGVFFEKGVICFDETEGEFSQESAQNCHQQIGDKVSSCGSKEFWSRIAKKNIQEIEALNSFIESFGGKKINGFYWTSTPHLQQKDGYAFYVYDGHKGVITNCKYINYKIRNVIEL